MREREREGETDRPSNGERQIIYRQKKRLTNGGTKRDRNIERGREQLTE